MASANNPHSWPQTSPLGALGPHVPGAALPAKVSPRAANDVTDKRLDRLEDVFERFQLKNGDVLSFHHHYRNGDSVMNSVIALAQRRGLRGLTLAPSSIFPVHAPLVSALEDGTIAHIATDYMRGPVADAVQAGKLPGVAILQSHGGRARALASGALRVDAAFIAAPVARACGDATGRAEPAACGPLGYAAVDALYARQSVVVAGKLQDARLACCDIEGRFIDAVVEVETAGDPSGLATATTAPSRTAQARAIAALTADVVAASGLLQEGLCLQSGAGGFSLACVPEIGRAMVAQGVTGGFLSGGITGAHVALLRAGLFREIHDVQCFDRAAVASAIETPSHHMMSAARYASPLENNIVSQLDVMLLGAVEVDCGFNVNVALGAQGRILGGPGGHPDAAAGASLSIVTTDLSAGGHAKIVKEVQTITTPGADVDAIVTPEAVAINPARPELARACARDGLPVIKVEDLAARAAQAGAVPTASARPERPKVFIEHREGGVLDVF
ncbi:citrate lyase subunit alpha [Primorskyibacter sp. S187A]|uniref:citrate lyase subunit alpha n=1 Tax=Primorskyibacter sp. S187A TaxID=3415130 RepID=UPI003C7A887E